MLLRAAELCYPSFPDNPSASIFHFLNNADGPGRQGTGNRILVIKLFDGVGGGIENIQSIIGADPYAAVIIFEKRGDGAVGQCGLTKNTVLDKQAAIVAIEAAIGTDPEDAGFILQNTLNGIVAKTIFNGEAGILKCVLCCCGQGCPQEGNNYKEFCSQRFGVVTEQDTDFCCW